MIKIFALAAAALVGTAGMSAAQVGSWRYGYSGGQYPGSVYRNGRCGGRSYGTGARRCGSRTGGPSGGISGRS